MVPFTITNARWPSGTSVGVYPASLFPGGPREGVAPGGAAILTASVEASGSVTFSALLENTPYVAGAQVSGFWRYVSFMTTSSATTSGVAALGERVTANEAAIAAALVGQAGTITSAAKPMKWGIQGGPTQNGHTATWAANNILTSRGGALEVEFNSTPATISAAVGEALTAGVIHPIVLIETPQGVVLSAVSPSAFGAGVAAIVNGCKADHPTAEVLYELVNEPYIRGPHNASNASDYALLCKAAYEAVNDPTQILIVSAGAGNYTTVNGAGEATGTSDITQNAGWLHDMAVSASGTYLKAHVNALGIHPYGPSSGPTDREGHRGLSMVPELRSRAYREGFLLGSQAIYLTEFGYGTSEAAENLPVALERCWSWYREGWLKLVNIYTDNVGGEDDIYAEPVAKAIYTSFASTHRSGATEQRGEVNLRYSVPLNVIGAVTARTYPGVKVPVPQRGTLALVEADYFIASGTEAKAVLKANGTNIPGFTEIEAVTANYHAERPEPAPLILSDSWIALTVTAVTGSPVDMNLTLVFERRYPY